MQIFPPGIFFPGGFFSQKNKMDLNENSTWKKNPAGLYKPLGHPSNY